MEIKKLAVVIQTEKDEVYQVFLKESDKDYIISLLKELSDDGTIKITNKLESITLSN